MLPADLLNVSSDTVRVGAQATGKDQRPYGSQALAPDARVDANAQKIAVVAFAKGAALIVIVLIAAERVRAYLR